MKIPEVKYVKFKSKRNFGIELEMTNRVPRKELAKAVGTVDKEREIRQSSTYDQDYSPNYWHVKFDRLVEGGEGGWEVSSYKGNGYKDLSKMSNVATALKEAGAVVNDDCGYHIHAEVADYGTQQLATLVANWMRIEPIICEMLPKHRRNHKYCKLLTTKIKYDESRKYTPVQFWDLVRPRNFDRADRRVSLNLCNVAGGVHDRLTVELRMPEGTLDNKDVKNWARFFIHFVDVNKTKSFPDEIKPCNVYEAMMVAGLHSEKPFFLLSAGLRETKIWVMSRILRYATKKRTKEEAEMFLNALLVNRPKKLKKAEAKKPKTVRDWWQLSGL
jgi:hypothetical protein